MKLPCSVESLASVLWAASYWFPTGAGGIFGATQNSHLLLVSLILPYEGPHPVNTMVSAIGIPRRMGSTEVRSRVWEVAQETFQTERIFEDGHRRILTKLSQRNRVDVPKTAVPKTVAPIGCSGENLGTYETDEALDGLVVVRLE